MEDSSKVLVSLIIGAAAGLVAGVLLAPQSGEETRQQLSDTADRVTDDLKRQSEKSLDAIDEVKNSVVELLDEVQSKLNKT